MEICALLINGFCGLQHKMLDENWGDYTCYRDKGWSESDYFYPVKLNPFKKLAGKLSDKQAIKIIRS
jgi:hypothetical protein